MDLIGALAEFRLLAIIRGRDADASVRTAEVLVESGIRLLEVSLTSTEGLTVLERVVRSVGRDALVGAGTVLSGGDAAECLAAGARFAVTPALCDGATEALRLGLPVLTGAMTPTEVLAAHRGGATAVKLFPAGSLGPGHLAALRGPFPEIDLVPVGGVGAADVPGYLRAGALAVGLGSPLVGDAPHGGDLEALRARAAAFRDAVRTDG
jgi:2-dehydro-3-deoxyphosphogluconate aldolase/(4S)-4-hydroxy-2-oxoglutarate aldolase